jgi:hypothetical protein
VCVLYECHLPDGEKGKKEKNVCNILSLTPRQRLEKKNKNHIDDDENDDSWKFELKKCATLPHTTNSFFLFCEVVAVNLLQPLANVLRVGSATKMCVREKISLSIFCSQNEVHLKAWHFPMKSNVTIFGCNTMLK